MADEVDFGAYDLADKKPSPTGVKPPAEAFPQTPPDQFGAVPLGASPTQGGNQLPTGPLSAKDVAFGAVVNAPSSLVEFVKSAAHPFMHPGETLESLGGLGKGLYSKAQGALGVQQDPEEKARTEAYADAMGGYLADRYGGIENIKRTIATDPVGALADISIPFTGGGTLAAKVPGTIGKVGQTMQRVGTAIDPLTATAKTVAAIPKATAYPMWWKSGASLDSLEKASKAGATLNPTFMAHLTGAASPEQMAQRLDTALRAATDARSTNWVSGMDALRTADKLPLDNLVNQLKGMQGAGYAESGFARSPATIQAAQQASDLLQTFINNPNAKAHTLYDFHELKQALDEMARQYPKGSKDAKPILDARKTVYDEILKKDPRYKSVMEDYISATNEIKDAFKELGGPNSGSVASRIRKILRKQDDKTKAKLIDDLARFDPDLPYAIAGTELAEIVPKGVRGWLSTGAMIASQGPMGALAIPLQSPRFSGGLQYGIGTVTGLPEQAVSRIPAPLRGAPYAVGEATQALEEDRTQRKDGGRISGSGIAEALMRAADKAKRDLGKETETLLQKPDEHIAKALEVAKRHI